MQQHRPERGVFHHRGLEVGVTISVKNDERIVFELPDLQPLFDFHEALDQLLGAGGFGTPLLLRAG